MFKRKSESKRILKMIWEDGEQYEVEQPGHMNVTKHQTVLQLLERRALRLHKNSNITTNENHDWSVNETGTVGVVHAYVGQKLLIRNIFKSSDDRGHPFFKYFSP